MTMRMLVRPQEIDWSALFRGLCGPAALIVAIIAQAYYDLCHGDLDAAGYFMSPYYRHHLQLLERPACWLPEGVELENPGQGDLEIVILEEQIMEL